MLVDLSDKRLYTSSYFKIKQAEAEQKRFNVVWGGSGSSKSHSYYQNYIQKLLTEKKHDLIVFRKYGSTIEESVYKGFVEIINNWGLTEFFHFTKKPYMIKNKYTGRYVIFKGLDDTEKIKSITNFKYCMMEEATEFTFADFRELNRRLRGIENIRMSFIFNPVSHTSWVKKHFFDTPSVTAKTTFTKCSYTDNHFLTNDDIQELIDLKEIDENDYNVYVLGEWGVITDRLAFKPSDWSLIDEIPEGAKRIPTGLDFGWNPDPLACTNYYIKDNYLIWDELAYDTEMHNTKQHDENGVLVGYSLEERLEERGFDKSQLIIAECAEPKSINNLRNAGFNIYAVKKRGVVEGVKLLKRYKHLITRRSKGVIYEFENYMKRMDRDGNILNEYMDKDNHHIDNARYVQFMKDNLW